MTFIDSLSPPERLYSRAEILDDRHLVPMTSGIYACFFRDIPGNIPISNCIRSGDHTLLYVGISNDLRKRIVNHLRGSARRSTLRFTVGSLLSALREEPLQVTISAGRVTFTEEGEKIINDWMEQNASFCWLECDSPQVLEIEALNIISLPLNLDGNFAHPFYEELTRLREETRDRAQTQLD